MMSATVLPSLELLNLVKRFEMGGGGQDRRGRGDWDEEGRGGRERERKECPSKVLPYPQKCCHTLTSAVTPSQVL